MEKKDTAELVAELGLCDEFKDFYAENKNYMVSETLPELLKNLMEKKSLHKAEVIRRSELTEVYAYQIFSGIRTPSREKLFCLAIGMELNLDETQSLLKCAGYQTLYVKLPFDSILIYGLCKRLSVSEINELLYRYGLETLG